MKRALNFNAGPAALPFSVLEKAKEKWLNFNDTGMAVMELSHRSKDYEAVHNQAITLMRKLLNIPENYEVLFLQGGASLQFTMVPMNLLSEGTGNYVLTGAWSEKALKEAKKIGNTAVISSSKEDKYRYIPSIEEWKPTDDAAYVHITSNNTIYGTQWHSYPSGLQVPVVADMSSDILSRPINVEDFGLIYAGAQKNLGPSGVTVVIIRKDLLELEQSANLPTMLDYRTYADHNSLYNTPPTLAIYLLSLVLEWADELGGLQTIEKNNIEKAKALYDAIDESEGFYSGHARKDSRSFMNVTFNLPTKELEAAFLTSAKEAGFIGLNGHRSVGGCRASIYNAIPKEHAYELAQFMNDFRRNSN